MQKHVLNTQVEAKQPDAIIAREQDILKAAQSYIAAGFALVPIPYGKKSPALTGWNQLANTITSLDQIERLTRQNIGIAHAYSGTCAIDIDDYIKADEFFYDNGINLTNLLGADDAVQISSGRENRAKLIYRTAEPLLSANYIVDKVKVIEFRCADSNGNTLQDVLPPSIHPDTTKPYKWRGDYTKLPTIPSELLTLWTSLRPLTGTPKDQNPQRKDMFPTGITIFPMGITSAVSQFAHPKTFFNPIITSVTQDEINQLCQDKEVQQHLLRFLGFKDFDQLFITGTVSVRSPFRKDTHKSGGLVIGADSGLPMFHDFGGAFGNHWLQLNALYASIISRCLTLLIPTVVDGRKKGSVTSAVWFLRLLIDAGVIAPAKVDMPDCPVDANKTIHKVHAGIKRLFEVRWAFKGREGEPITLGRKFVGPWCGVSEDQARESIKYLLRYCIHTAGKHGPANIYLPGYKSPQKPANR